jgi:hypothetical protein
MARRTKLWLPGVREEEISYSIASAHFQKNLVRPDPSTATVELVCLYHTPKAFSILDLPTGPAPSKLPTHRQGLVQGYIGRIEMPVNSQK